MVYNININTYCGLLKHVSAHYISVYMYIYNMNSGLIDNMGVVHTYIMVILSNDHWYTCHYRVYACHIKKAYDIYNVNAMSSNHEYRTLLWGKYSTYAVMRCYVELI